MGPCIRMIMKKVITLAATALALMFATVSHAQVIGKDIVTKNEISVSYGTLSNSEWIEVFGEVVTVMFGGETKTKGAVGPVSAEYFRRVSPVVAVGAIGSFSSFKDDMMRKTVTPGSTSGETTSEKVGDYTRSYITFMPAAKFNWLRKKHFGSLGTALHGTAYKRFAPRYSQIFQLNDTLEAERLISRANVSLFEISCGESVTNEHYPHFRSPLINVGIPQTMRITFSEREAMIQPQRPTFSRHVRSLFSMGIMPLPTSSIIMTAELLRRQSSSVKLMQSSPRRRTNS